mmetsp:Transcript_25325/g.84578  ORF Transcript_25325/g.84578 Transcript_25325/m.84578 type:complete len:201 (+) Transcript_25325:197-799(+)
MRKRSGCAFLCSARRSEAPSRRTTSTSGGARRAQARVFSSSSISISKVTSRHRPPATSKAPFVFCSRSQEDFQPGSLKAKASLTKPVVTFQSDSSEPSPEVEDAAAKPCASQSALCTQPGRPPRAPQAVEAAPRSAKQAPRPGPEKKLAKELRRPWPALGKPLGLLPPATSSPSTEATACSRARNTTSSGAIRSKAATTS